MIPNNLSSQHGHQYALTSTQACQATLCKSIAIFANIVISKLEYTKKNFLLKNISLKHSGVKSYFKAFIKTNTIL